jgi:prepilin-type N-terminal cleavage/methylation domain-containing protein
MRSLLPEARAFTLVELLVVIAIIGVLASIILVSVSGARGGGRDATRVEDLRSMLQTLAYQSNDVSSSLLPIPGCASGGAANACTIFSAYSDPSGKPTPCSIFATSACQYVIVGQGGAQPTATNFEVCAYLESGSGVYPKGLININSTSYALKTGCTTTW